MWGLIRLARLNWRCIKTHTHRHTTSPPPPARTTWASWVINVSVSQPLCPGRQAGAGGSQRPVSGPTLADTGWAMSACCSQGTGGTGGSGSAQSSGLGERSMLSRVWLIRQEAECPRCHYQYPWPPAALSAYAVGVTQKGAENKHGRSDSESAHKQSQALLACASLVRLLMWEVSYQLDHIYSQQQLWLNLILVMTHSETNPRGKSLGRKCQHILGDKHDI